MEALCFRLPGHGDSTLKHMNALRSRQHFCDVTIIASDNQTFRGHKVVLAACSPFLRDQFLLNPAAKLQVSLLHSSAVVCNLLLSCYTGLLQFSPEDIVNYLTAASYLQMEHIVERCRGALKKYMQRRTTPSPPTGVRFPAPDGDRPAGGAHNHGHSPLLDESCIKVDPSDEEAARREYDLFNEELEMGGYLRDSFSVAAARVLRRRYTEPRASRARGRGFKKRKWQVLERRPLGLGLAPGHQDLWYPGAAASGGLLGGGPFGMDYGRGDALTAAAGYLGVDLPPMDFGAGEADGDAAAMAAADLHGRYLLEGGGGESGEGPPSEGGGDESVAVVGSTSSVGAGPVICDHCGVAFPSPHALAVHVRASHLLFTCPCCGKHFQAAVSLTRHMAVHRGGPGKSHQCPLCYKTFTQKSTLIDHMNLHSGERPHRCAYCHARFAHKPALRRHLKEQHGKTTGQNSLHEQEERAREQGGGGPIREEEQELMIREPSLS
ncbi:hypothetical protein NHX12_023876 [Muraenolepis orangiensis]|uniref:Zinc finger and BTB domain-containing protein 12 n=1 Tax=Muraenolepis orangiensis TaxID=630683 RepID=A0A9Q0EN16_9TELE|nr:hypothetical protein NHX12_023876 [Muraenolepis orangiensis]